MLNLQTLRIGETKITDAILSHIGKLAQLENLNLTDTTPIRGWPR